MELNKKENNNMKVKYKEVKFNYCNGDVHYFYIKKYKKHWWNFWWNIEMNGSTPALYNLVDGEFIRKI